jgi:roadblock/LC7 domain-containing protein
MSVVSQLAAKPGVIAAGEYSYRGDRFSFQGQLDEEKARMASIMCRATTMAVHMQIDMMKFLQADCGCAPSRGWVVRGDKFSVCVIANVFCFFENAAKVNNEIIQFMIENVAHQEGDLI